MPQANLRVRIGFAIAVLFTLLPAGCGPSSEGKAAPSNAPAPAPTVRRVEVVTPVRRTIRRSVGEPGQIEAYETTPIYAKIAGYVRTVAVDIGDPIQKGQVLAELWVPEVEAELEQKRAALAEAEARRAQAESAVRVAQAAVASAEARVAEVQAGIRRADADLERWRLEYRRVEQLFHERAMTGTLLDETRNKLRAAESSRDEVRAQVQSAEAARNQARSELDKARADVVAAAASIDVARAEIRHAEALLGYARIEAPFDGLVIRRNIDTGHLTVPGASAAAPLFVVSRSDLVTITVDVPETYALAVDPGDRALIVLQALGDRTVEGKVTRTSWALDPKTRTLRAEIDIPNPGGTLRPGLYAYATVIVEEHTDVLTVPTTALIREPDRTSCVTIVDGKAVRRSIAVGLDDGTSVEVVSGLADGAVVVKANAAALADGQPVQPVAADSQKPSSSRVVPGVAPDALITRRIVRP